MKQWKTWNVWPWNWGKRSPRSFEECESVEEMIALIDTERQTGRRIKRRVSFWNWEDSHEGADIGDVAFLLTGGIASWFYMQFCYIQKRNAVEHLGTWQTIIYGMWILSILTMIVTSWWLTGAIALFSAVNYTLVWALFGDIPEEHTHEPPQNLTPSDWMKRRIERARELAIGEESENRRELHQTEREISALSDERMLWEKRKGEGSMTADEAIETIDLGIAQLSQHRDRLRARFSKMREILAAGQARVEAQIPLLQERDMLKQTMAKIPDSKELRDRLRAVDERLKQVLRDEFGLVEQTLRRIEAHVMADPHMISTDEIRRRAALTVHNDIAYEQAIDELHEQMLTETPADMA